MTATPKFFLPGIYPPPEAPDPAAVLDYYMSIANLGVEVTADSGGDDGWLEIAITNPDQDHAGDSFPQPVAVSTVFAPTAGFVRFYPSSAALPTPDGQPLPALDGVTSDIGSVVIRVWAPDYRALAKSVSPLAPRPNLVVLGWLDQASVAAAFPAEIAKLGSKVLETSWADSGGTGAMPPRPALEAAFLQRFLAGNAEVFVAAGAVLGKAAVASPAVALSAGATPAPAVAKLRLGSFFAPTDPAPAVAVAAEDLLDNAGNEAVFAAHPVLVALNGEIEIKFESTFTIWDNATFQYVPLTNTEVRLLKGSGAEVDHAKTDAAGRIELTAQLARGELIYFRYDTKGKPFGASGSGTFPEDVTTDKHRARKYLVDNVNTHTYRAKYDIYPRYKVFRDELSESEDLEFYLEDRGNASRDDTRDGPASVEAAFAYWLTFSSQKAFLIQMEESEQVYRRDHVPPMFTLLSEGDSWFHYPPDRNDFYGHLDRMIAAALLETPNQVAYVRFPLQHFGDRSDQMFVGDDDDERRQWHFTHQFLTQYKIDLVLCSAGGNDLADPGISNWLIDPGAVTRPPDRSPVAPRFRTCFTDSFENGGYFDPFRMADKGLGVEDQLLAKRILSRSFGDLLSNHPWALYGSGKMLADQIPQGALYSILNQRLAALPGGIDFGEPDPLKQELKLDELRAKVVAGFQLANLDDLPDPDGDPHQRLLATVFDSVRYKARFDAVKNNWRRLLNAAQAAGTFVVAHTYCYGIFSEEATKLLVRRRGPWFAPRFHEARIDDRRIRYICVKALIDNYVGYVLTALKAEFANFDFVDLRTLSLDPKWWADEIHLNTDGFREAAKKVFSALKNNPRYAGVLGS